MKRFVILLSVLVFLAASCKKDVNNKPSENPPPESPAGILPKEVTVKNITLVFPANINMDVASCSIYSQSFISYPEEDGGFNVAYEKGFPNIAWVFDKNKNIILAGFITDTSKTISVGSTAEVLLYFGLGTTFQPLEVIQKYIAGTNTIPGMAEWKARLENIFIADPQMLNKHLFADALKETVAKVLKAGTTTERKPADVTVDANDIRSGLQIAENGFSSYTITNTIRRRSYAYLYKMNYTDKDGKSHTVNSEVSGSVASLSETKISPTTAIRDYKGVLQDWAAGNGEKFAATVSSPIDVPLEDNESMANFKVRVVGPGMPVSKSMTTYERERWWNATLQTALFDFLLPAVLDVIGHKEFLNNVNAPGNKLEGLEDMVKKTGDLIAVIPTLSDALEAGNYSTLISDVFYTIVNGKMSNKTDEWIKAIYYAMGNYVMKAGSNYYADPSAFDDRVENLVKILEMVDIGMKAIDYGRIAKAIVQSKTLEEWDLKAREVQINLDPPSFSIGKGGTQNLTAYIKTSLGAEPPVIEYEWVTTGKYGYLTDERGHQGNSFSSSLNTVTYHENDTSTGEGDKTDSVKVNVYVKKGTDRTKIGSSASIAKIAKQQVFNVGVVTYINISPRTPVNGEPRYYAGNPSWHATIPAVAGAKSYDVRTIINGEKGPVNHKTVTGDETTFGISGLIGTAGGTNCDRAGLFLKDGLNQKQMEEEKARQEALISCWQSKGITGAEIIVYF